tara:strand:+ start:364 stop:1122 length:759 start_codon:yes stop_codon:yes gene_type:complete
MNRVYMFDVDGTLTPSRQKMTKEFKKFFKQWALKNTFYLVTGSDLPKLQEQMDGMEIHSSGIFTCCGNQFWQSDPAVHPKHCDLIYENKFEMSRKLKTLLDVILMNSPYPNRYGNHIEDRGSMVNFSIVGRDCTQLQRDIFFKWDNEHQERKKISKVIKHKFPELDAVIGGQISIDIYPKGNDKSQIFKHIEEIENFNCPEEYIFIGDRMEEGGNDYPLAQLLNHRDRPYGYTYETEGFEHTQRILENTHNG